MMAAVLSFGRNEEVYGEGEPAEYLYTVQSGCVRTSKILKDGRRQIGAFYWPGDVFGLEAGGEHSFSAEALAPTTIRIIKRATLASRVARDGAMANQLLALTVGELQRPNASCSIKKCAGASCWLFAQIANQMRRKQNRAADVPAGYRGLSPASPSKPYRAHLRTLKISPRLHSPPRAHRLRNRSALARLCVSNSVPSARES